MELVDEIVQEFLIESYDSLDKLDSDFVALEENPDDRDRLANIFRTVHTIKGTSGFLAFPKLEKVAHVGENLLVPLRDGELQLNNEIVDSLLGMVDAIRQILGNVESSGSEGDDDYTPLIQKLEAAKQQVAAEAAESTTAESTAPENDTAPSSQEETAQETSVPDTSEPASEGAEPAAKEATPTATDESSETPAVPPTEPTEPTAQSSEASPAPKKATAPAKKSSTGKSLSDSTVRINVDLLDQLMNLVGELVLTRNQILQHSQDSSDGAITDASQRLNQITSELQEGVMKTRMQPIRAVWSKLPRVVRDLSNSIGKQVKVEMEGANTELDKTILEAIKDPLTHIVRNSVDHGIETAEVRKAAGKPAEGTLLLRAFHEGGQVIIEIVDDGGGINIHRVRDKAIEKGLVAPEKAAAMNNRELINLILLPGFSTAAKVTNVSGRGVGMDVVRTNIEQIGGSLEVHSVEGEGTTLRIKIPLTLAIVPALIINSGSQNFAIPQVSLQELLRIEGDKVDQEIEILHNVPVYRLRGKLLPLLYLNHELQLTSSPTPSECSELAEEPSDTDSDPEAGSSQADPANESRPSVNIVVLQAEDRQFGLVVDAISDTQEIVVKPLGKQLDEITTFAGATIMGDGSVALILDVVGLAKAGGVLTPHKTLEQVGINENEANHRSASRSMLIVDRGDGNRVAIELSTVDRLEEFEISRLEQTDMGAVVQYRNGILPLMSMIPNFTLARSTPESNPEADEPSEVVQAVVFSGPRGSIGVIVREIIDVVDFSPAKNDDSSPLAEQGLQVIQERVTQVIDLAGTIAQLPPVHLATS